MYPFLEVKCMCQLCCVYSDDFTRFDQLDKKKRRRQKIES